MGDVISLKSICGNCEYLKVIEGLNSELEQYRNNTAMKAYIERIKEQDERINQLRLSRRVLMNLIENIGDRDRLKNRKLKSRKERLDSNPYKLVVSNKSIFKGELQKAYQQEVDYYTENYNLSNGNSKKLPKEFDVISTPEAVLSAEWDN